jgi:ATP-dependent helicase HrpA
MTAMGAELAKLPLDPRVGRMIVEARERGALDEVLVIASALSVQDVRDRPMEAQQAADQAHVKFDDEKSEFAGYLKLWKWLETSKGGASTSSARTDMSSARATHPVRPELVEGAPAHKLSNRQYEQLLRQNFVNIRRVREWRDIHSQLVTVVAEHKWRINTKPASYEELHMSMLAGLLGNVGWKIETEAATGGREEKGQRGEYLGARGIKFFAHPGAHLAKKPGRWIVAAELVETTRLFGRGLANIEPQWLEKVAGHLLKKQLLDPHWEKKAAEVVALERATLYGLVVYSGRKVNFGRVDMVAAREIFIREALVANNWETKLPFLATNEKLIAQVEELEHKSRRQDVLVDDELIYAFYDQQLPADVCSGYSFENWYREEIKQNPKLLMLTRDELMRHEAAGITTQSFPKTIRLGGVDCQTTYLHEPGDAKDGMTVTVPLFVLNQVNDERCEWLVPGMLKDKIQALLKSLHQRPRSRLVPLPESAARLAAELNVPEAYGATGLIEALLKKVRDATQVDVQRADFKLDMLSPHLFMNFRVVDEHGRQLGTGRNLGALKAELGAKARGAFQALAGLKLAGLNVAQNNTNTTNSVRPELVEGLPRGMQQAQPERGGQNKGSNQPLVGVFTASAATKNIAKSNTTESFATPAGQRYTAWIFGELPELMEINKGGQTLIGFPALIDLQDAVSIEVFDEPDVAAAKHQAGLRRLFALHIKDALKYLEKNIPDLTKMAAAYMLVGRAADNSGGGTIEELREQIIAKALDRAFLLDPLPTNAAEFTKRLEEGRGRLTLISSEIARLVATILQEYATAARKLKDTKNAPDATADAATQLARLMPKRFIAVTPFTQLHHFARYLKAITARLDKYRADPTRDATKLAELRPSEQNYWRLVAERKGAVDDRMMEFRWLLEELRVSFFAQELRTPQPVSVKRLDKLWVQIKS